MLVCVPPIAKGSLTNIFDTSIGLSCNMSSSLTCFISITSSRSEISVGISSGDNLESDIKYYETYLYDSSLIVGKYYKIENDAVIPYDLEISDETKLSLKTMLFDKQSDTNLPDTKQFDEHVSQWANLLNQPIPCLLYTSPSPRDRG